MIEAVLTDLEAVRSHRDPSGSVTIADGRVLRVVRNSWRPIYERFQASAAIQSFVRKGDLIGSREVVSDDMPMVVREVVDSDHFVLEHERIEFPSFPYEWPAEMLHEAAALTLELADGIREEGLRLKDATPFNILFRGTRPVFIDVLSLEQLPSGDPLWRPEGQFSQTMLLPLLLNRSFGLPVHRAFWGQREGVTPEEVYAFLGFRGRLKSPNLWLVTLPTLLAGRSRDASLYRPRNDVEPEKAAFLLNAVMRRLRRQLKKLEPRKAVDSVWSDYEQTHSYSSEAFAAKREFVARAAEQSRPHNALDIGCNEGAFTFLMAQNASSTVAIDYDPVVVGRVWQGAKERGLNVLPLVQNLSWPSPALGWRYREYPSFLDRARGRFDFVLMLAVLHHLLVTDRVPLDEIFKLVAEITTKYLLIEFVGTNDRMFRTISRGRDDLFEWLNREHFEIIARNYFDIVESLQLPGVDRTLYLMRRKHQTS